MTNNIYNETPLNSICASLCEIMGIEPPKNANPSNSIMTEYAKKAFEGRKADRIFMYNPDAIAMWIYQKYPALLSEAIANTDLSVPFKSVMPSVTPVCFGTMYTGAEPEVHGIMKYTKPVIRIDTIFDALIRAGKKPVILATKKSSLSMIYLERPMDYYIYDTIEEVNAKTLDLIIQDKHDFYVVYNGNYDHMMHRNGPEGLNALVELKVNSHIFAVFKHAIMEHWNHDTLLGFAMDHGCHEIEGDNGSHGLDMPEDLNIVHLYSSIKRENQ